MIHELKTWPEFFLPLCQDKKRHEIRRNDRPFAVGDLLWLRQYEHEKTFQRPVGYTGHVLEVQVTYMTAGMSWGLPSDLVVMSVRNLRILFSLRGETSETLFRLDDHAPIAVDEVERYYMRRLPA